MNSTVPDATEKIAKNMFTDQNELHNMSLTKKLIIKKAKNEVPNVADDKRSSKLIFLICFLKQHFE